MMQIAAYGKLGGDPKSIETNSRKAMAVASLAVNLEERGVEDPEPEWIGVVAFGKQAEALVKHAKGECVSVSGRVQRNRWIDRDGNERVQLQVIADGLASARTVRPGGGREQGTGAQAHGDDSGGRAAESVTAGEDFDDEIPF